MLSFLVLHYFQNRIKLSCSPGQTHAYTVLRDWSTTIHSPQVDQTRPRLCENTGSLIPSPRVPGQLHMLGGLCTTLVMQLLFPPQTDLLDVSRAPGRGQRCVVLLYMALSYMWGFRERGTDPLEPSSMQGSDSKQFSFHGPQDPAATTQLCHQSAKAATDTTEWMGRAVSNKTLLQKRTAGQPTGHSLPSPVPQESCISCLT